jgi:glycosyltransferase involved in cell wall biosynthesis
MALVAARRLIAEIRRLSRGRERVIVYAHGGRGIGLLRQSLLLYVSRAAGARTMLHLHSITVDAYLRSRTGRTFLRFCLRPADRVCVLTEWWRSRLERVCRAHRIVVVPNPLPPRLEAIARKGKRTRRNVSGLGLRVLTMTRLVPGKGVDLAIRTMAELPSTVSLVVAGDGTEWHAYQRLTLELGLGERVSFAGWVDGPEKEDLLRSSDVFLLPSRYDSFGMAFLEAMAFGLPVVACRWGPIEEVVPDGRAGILVEGRDPRKLAEAVTRLLDAPLRRKLGAGGQAHAVRYFGVAVAGARLKATMEALARGS